MRPLLAQRSGRAVHDGATLVEFVVIAPTLMMLALAMMQTGLVFHAKNILNYATFEAARAGALQNALPSNLHAAFARAMVPYYGGGRTTVELARSHGRALADLAGALRIEILSPTRESFEDFHSPRAAEALRVGARVIPSTHLDRLTCPADRPSCASDPASNRSGQTLQDANLLKIRVTYGIPRAKQIPLAGRFFNWAVATLYPDHPDPFRRALLAAGRIPLVSHVTVRMQSDAIENGALLSLPGPGNAGVPVDAGAGADAQGRALPSCPWSDPLCTPSSAHESAAGNGTGMDEEVPHALDDEEPLQCSRP